MVIRLIFVRSLSDLCGLGRYARAKQFKRRQREVRVLGTRLGRVIRDIRRKTEGNERPREIFEVLPKRWIVERTFAWNSRNRRLARDFERHVRSVVAFIRLAMIRIMPRRLAATQSQ